MLLALFLALGASTSAAISTVLKFRSARRQHAPAWASRLPHAVASIVAQPMFFAAMVFDATGVALQISALRFGSLSVVQPVLSAALVISLGLNHAIDRTRIKKREMLFAAMLVGGLILFLFASDAISPNTQLAIGERDPGIALAVVGTVIVAGGYFFTRHREPAMHARALAVGVAVIYATTAGLMKSVTHITELRGWLALVLSWQLWVLLATAALGLVMAQRAFATAPLHVSLPVTASLDPLFSVAIGLGVYDETLRTTPLGLLGEAVGLAMLLFAIVKLTTLEASTSEQAGEAHTHAAS